MRINKRAVKTVLKEIGKMILALITCAAIWYAWDYFVPFATATDLCFRLRMTVEILLFIPAYFVLIRTNAKTVMAFLLNVVFLIYLYDCSTRTPHRMGIPAMIVMIMYMMLIFVISERKEFNRRVQEANNERRETAD